MQIRTKLHHVLPLESEGEVHLTAPEKGTAPFASDFGYVRPEFLKFFETLQSSPKFVIDEELLDITTSKEYQASLLALHVAGVLRLPFPAMWVELPDKNTTSQGLVHLWDLQDPHCPFPPNEPRAGSFGSSFAAYVMRVHRDEEGEYLVLSPSMLFIAVDEQESEAWLRITGQAIRTFFTSNSKIDDLVEDTYVKDAGNAWSAIMSALLTMRTMGVVHEPAGVGPKLNKRRVASKKPPIPDHTVIRIGHVYRRADGDETDTYDKKRHPRPHWRRAHVRNIAYGKGRTERKPKLFPPMLIAWRPVTPNDKPPVPTYVVKK